MSDDDSTSPRRPYRRKPVVLSEPNIVPMPADEVPRAMAALTRWLAELTADPKFQARHAERLRQRRDDVDHRSFGRLWRSRGDSQ